RERNYSTPASGRRAEGTFWGVASRRVQVVRLIVASGNSRVQTLARQTEHAAMDERLERALTGPLVQPPESPRLRDAQRQTRHLVIFADDSYEQTPKGLLLCIVRNKMRARCLNHDILAMRLTHIATLSAESADLPD